MNHDMIKARTIIPWAKPNLHDATRNYNIYKQGTTGERIASDRCDTLMQRDPRKSTGPAERGLTYSGDAGGNNILPRHTGRELNEICHRPVKEHSTAGHIVGVRR
jgi:hypothetical protein